MRTIWSYRILADFRWFTIGSSRSQWLETAAMSQRAIVSMYHFVRIWKAFGLQIIASSMWRRWLWRGWSRWKSLLSERIASKAFKPEMIPNVFAWKRMIRCWWSRLERTLSLITKNSFWKVSWCTHGLNQRYGGTCSDRVRRELL